MDIGLMIEGQNGLTWNKWMEVARIAEDKGFAGLYRSDHFTNASAPDIDSLECWTSLTWLASHTKKIQFGPLVSPISFRHPAMLARMACAVDDLSGGRLQFGVGAGWQEREHHNFSYDLLGVSDRMDRFTEGLEIIAGLLQSDKPITFEGEYFKVYDAVVLPRPARSGGPPIVIGGNGPKRTIPLAARYANEWNAVYLNHSRFEETNALLDKHLKRVGRNPSAVRRTMMTGCIYASSSRELNKMLEKRGRKSDELQKLGIVVGFGDDFVRQIERLKTAGVQRLMLQWIDLENTGLLEEMADHILPVFHGDDA